MVLVNNGKQLLALVSASLAEIEEAYSHPELVAVVIEKACERGFVERREVQRCVAFSEIITGMASAIHNSDAKSLLEHLELFNANESTREYPAGLQDGGQSAQSNL